MYYLSNTCVIQNAVIILLNMSIGESVSLLKIKLARKLSNLLGYEVSPDDVHFHKNGCRRDVVRWTTVGYECFAPAAFSVRDDVSLKIAERPQIYGIYEIFAEQKGKVEQSPIKPNPFDTAFR